MALVLLISSRARGQNFDGADGEDDTTQNADAAFYKSQLKALEKDKESGLLDEEQLRVARAELAREALTSKKMGQNQHARGHWSMGYTLVALLAFVGIALGTYFYLGSPALKNQPLATRLAAIENLDVDDAVAKIEAQLQLTPDDIRGWRVLVPVYVRQGAVDKAINAFENIARIEGENAENLTDIAEAYLMKANGEPTPEALALLEKATNLDPRHVRSRFYLANIALNNEQFELAKQRWLDILELATGDEPWIGSAQNGLATARAGLGEVGPSQDDVAAAAEMDEADRNDMIAQMVQGLAERLYEEGGNVEEWARLIRSRAVLGQFDAANEDIARARAAFENDQSGAAALEEAIAQDVERIEKEQSE